MSTGPFGGEAVCFSLLFISEPSTVLDMWKMYREGLMNENPAVLRQETISAAEVWKTMLRCPCHRIVFMGEEKTGL